MKKRGLKKELKNTFRNKEYDNQKSKGHINKVFNTFKEAGINWKADTWKLPRITHTHTHADDYL